MPPNEGGYRSMCDIGRRKPWSEEGQRHLFYYCTRSRWVTNQLLGEDLSPFHSQLEEEEYHGLRSGAVDGKY